MYLAEVIIRAIDLFYIKPVSSFVSRQTFRYAACGGANMVFLWFCYFLTYNYIVDKEFTDLGFIVISPHIAAMIIVIPITFLSGFWLNRNVAFRWSPLTTSTQLVRYALSVVGSILLNYVFLKFMVEVCGFWATPSQVLTSILITVYSYLAARYFTFRNAVRE